MKNVTKSTLRTVAQREAEEASLSLDPWTAIDASDKVGEQIAKEPYGVEYKGTTWMIDEAKDECVNTQTGETTNLATFMRAYRKYSSRDTTFSLEAIVLESHEIEDVVNQINNDCNYIMEDVVTQSVSSLNEIVYTTSRVFIYEDVDGDFKMLRIEKSKKTEYGADLTFGTDDKIAYGYNGICNSMLYYTDDVSSVLSFLGFKDMLNGVWYHREKGIIANVGEYNFFKKSVKGARTNTKTQKCLDTLLSM